MRQSLRIPVVLLLVQTIVLGQAQTPTPVEEPPAQAQKLLRYAAQLEEDAKRARSAGQQHALAGHQDMSAEQLINQRTSTHNGIYVDQPKVYDDSLLQQMLASAQGHLAALQGFDQGSLTRAIGGVTGANQQIASFGISGGTQPPVQQTAFGNITSPFPAPSAAAPGPTTTLPSSSAPSASDILDEQVQITSEIAEPAAAARRFAV